MQHARRDSHRLQCATAADSEEQLLPDAHTTVAAIQTRSQIAILGCIAGDIGIEQQQIASTDLNAPNSGANRTAARFDLSRHRLAVGADREFHWELVEVGFEIFLLLPAVAIESLTEISLT